MGKDTHFPPGGGSLTICLALLCEDAKKVVAVADRMVSVEFLSLQFEHRTKKVELLGKHFVALTAGDALAHTEILRKASLEIEQVNQPSVRDVAYEIEEAFIKARQGLAENTVLRRVGLDYATFLEQQRNLAPELVAGLMSEYQKVELDLELLIAGTDSSGAHLYHINDPGVMTCFDAIGYAVIGSGLPHAEGFLTEADYSPAIPLNQALWLGYAAKRRSERAPGVGTMFTDALVIDKAGGVRFLSKNCMEAFATSYQQYLATVRKAAQDIDRLIPSLELTFQD